MMAVKAQTCFMTTKERQLFPVGTAQDRFGNELCPLRGAPHLGPGAYENDEKTSFVYLSKKKILSSKGYSLGARTGPRIKQIVQDKTPSPAEYQKDVTETLNPLQRNKPFGVGSERFPLFRRELMDVIPGAGAYDTDATLNKKVQWHQSFGGSPIQLPSVTHKSTIDRNTEKLYSTKEERKYFRKLAYLKLYY
ncbi:protein pitchfork [Biomphalaria glabrata]|nr:protein pitchfork-like [Biomphalaria glabrata]